MDCDGGKVETGSLIMKLRVVMVIQIAGKWMEPGYVFNIANRTCRLIKYGGVREIGVKDESKFVYTSMS